MDTSYPYKHKEEGRTVIGHIKVSVNLLNSEVEMNQQLILGDNNNKAPPRHRNTVFTRTICILMSILLLASVAFVAALAVMRSQNEVPSDSTIQPTHRPKVIADLELDPIRLQGGHYIFSKRDWRGLNATRNRQLLHPTPVVIISSTSSQQCKTFDRCSQILRGIQTAHMRGRGARTGAVIVDIGYNFLIGGDGNVYEGRGWDVTSFHKKPEGVLGISFIGNYDKYELTHEQIEVAQELLEFGVKLEKLSPSYLLIAHSQTLETNSPGRNVMNVIETWPHWSPDYRIV